MTDYIKFAGMSEARTVIVFNVYDHLRGPFWILLKRVRRPVVEKTTIKFQSLPKLFFQINEISRLVGDSWYTDYLLSITVYIEGALSLKIYMTMHIRCKINVPVAYTLKYFNYNVQKWLLC